MISIFSFLFTLMLQIVGKLMPLFLHELYVLLLASFKAAKSGTQALVNNAAVKNSVNTVVTDIENDMQTHAKSLVSNLHTSVEATAKTLASDVEANAIVLYRRLGNREKIALVIATAVFPLLIAGGVYLFNH